MNGRTHAVIGASLIPLSATAAGMGIPDTAVLTAIAAGFALGPDIDHPNATISRLSPQFVHEMFHGLSEISLRLFSTKTDRMHAINSRKRGIDPAHRALTHTLLFSAAAAGLGYLCAQTGVGLALLAFLSVMACRALLGRKKGESIRWGFFLMTGAACAVAACAFFSSVSPGHVAFAAWMGWMSHIIADACTKAGVPFLWPLTIKRRKWWRLRLLGGWLESGDSKEWFVAAGIIISMNVAQLVLFV